jgi:hypothetical protein
MLQRLLLFAVFFSLLLAGQARAYRYFYLSDCEQTRLGEYVCFGFGDTLDGPMRTNTQFCLRGPCVIMDTICLWDEPHDWDSTIVFLVPPQYNCGSSLAPADAEHMRRVALQQGRFRSDPGKSIRLYLHGDSITFCRWWTGTLFDSTDSWTEEVINEECLFFDTPLEVQGHLTGELYIGCSHNILLMDDVVYDDADPVTGWTPETSNNMLLLASEREIKIANTYANGRNNSNGLGLNQTNRDSTSIVITAALYALHESFTFEQQNDPDSGYVYQDPPGTIHRDDRGTVYLFGSITQHRRGYMHRSNNGSTGYLKYWRYDHRFRTRFNPYPFFTEISHCRTTDTLDFGGIPVGQIARDTAYVCMWTDGGFGNLGSITATPPFGAQRIPPFYGERFAIPVSITPAHVGLFTGILQVMTDEYPYINEIVLRAFALPGGAPQHFSLTVSPNPFNLTTTLHYSVPQAGAVKIVLYDVLGRIAKQTDLERVSAGEHTVQINASELASGVYFVHLRAGDQTLTRKVFLLK